MKLTILNLLLAFTLVFSACKKKTDIVLQEEPLVTQLKAFVKNEVSETAFIELDWKKLNFIDRNGKHEIAKIPLIGNTKGSDRTLYLRILKNTFVGNYFEFNYDNINSEITTTSLDEKRVCIATTEGQLYKGNSKIYENGKLVVDTLTPSVSISIMGNSAYYSFDNHIYIAAGLLGIGQPSWTVGTPFDASNLESLVPIDGSGGGGNGTPEIIEFEENDWEAKSSADIVKIFKCFDLIPNGPNTTFEISLNADIPANQNETTPFLLNGNPGHAFVTITKKNGTQSVTQNFGFYPNSGPKSLGLSNVSSKVVDDNNHEVNASIKMNINNITFDLIRQNAIFLASQDYNLESNNCANFAIDLFNIGRLGTDITVPSFIVNIPPTLISPGITAVMAKSPHTLFGKLNEMKTSGHPEAANIQVNRTHDLKSGNSQGECQ